VSGKSPNLVRDLGGLAAARMGVRLLGVAVGWVVARVIGPEALGQLSVPNLLFVLLPFATLGFADGLARELPLARRDNPPFAKELLRTAWLLNLLLLGLCALGVLAARPFLRPWLPDTWLLWLSVGAGLANGLLRVALIGLSGAQRIRDLASLQVVQGLLRALFVLALLFLLPERLQVYVLHAGMVLSLLGALVWAARQGVVQAPRLNPAAVGMLARSGPPIAFASLFLMLLVVGDRLVMSRILEGQVRGFFEQAVLIRDGLLLLPGVLLTVLVPDHSARQNDPARRPELLKDVARQSGLVAVLTPVLLVLLCLQLPWLMDLLLPRFIPGVPLFQLAVLGMGPIFLSYIFVSLMIGEGRSVEVGLLGLLSLAGLLALDVWAPRWPGLWLNAVLGHGATLPGMDLALGASLSALAAFWLFTLVVMGRGVWCWGFPWRRVLGWLLPSFLFTLVALPLLAKGWLQHWLPGVNAPALAICLLLLWVYEGRSGQLSKVWRARRAAKA
jgi:O-antigen/teichoic acid export membrane protein